LSPPHGYPRVDLSAYGAKRPVRGSVIALLDVVFQDRGLQLIETKSRALKKDEIHELMVTDDDETHMPNHMNIVVKAPSLDPVEMAVGSKLEFKPG